VTHGPGLAAALAVLLTTAGCSMTLGAPPPRPAAATRPLTLYALQGREVRLAHLGPAVEATTPIATALAAGKPVGDVQPLPVVVSDRHQAELVGAESLYGRQQYGAALAMLEPAYRDEPTNPFVLEAYGRTLYRQRERARAFEVYRTLVDLLDAEWQAGPAAVTVDLWFVDAYWKVGTLHMDRAEWERAAFEISRALAGGFAGEWLAVDQALAYLIRAYHEMGRRDIARYYAERALERNPKHPIAQRYLDPLSRDSK
jgi:tetratricopeptide (TPR) repeat protein